MKVLVADDSKAVRRMIVSMVAELRPYVDEVLEAEDAVSVRRAAAAVGRELAVAVADWDLPGLPGSRIAAELKDLCGGRDVAVLACINPGQQAEVAEAGPLAVKDVAVRPFTADELRRKLLAILAQCPEAVAEASAVLRTIVSSTDQDLDLPFFLQLPSEVMGDFLELASTRRSPPGTLLLQAGARVDALYVVASGTAEAVKPDGTAGAPVEEGNCFGEIAFMSGKPAEATVRARTRVEVLSLDRARLAELLRRQPRMSQYLGILAAKRSRATAARAAPGGTSGMGGSLRSMPFADLIQMLHSTGKTGELQLEGKGERGGIAFAEGNVLHAWAGDRRGEDAFFRLSAWKEGMFYFKAGAAAKESTIGTPTMSLLMEAMRRLDEEKRGPAAVQDATLGDLFGEGEERKKPSEPPPDLFGDAPPRPGGPPPGF